MKKNQYYIKQGRVLCERKTLVLNEKQTNSICDAINPVSSFCNEKMHLVAVFFEVIGVGEMRKITNRPSSHVPIMVSSMYLLSCFSVLVLGAKNSRAWNEAHPQVGKKDMIFPGHA